ncbi:hypothetical protein PanWU01x14_182700 [Parasponia andersonii]|uniref:Uncharacterized protein n=1 Tax=Parasponia andersonii TaxID=3476 RepID=A0A2P5C5I1_PARAD|nr:hypothetical protein PanWU01x14_182700 [Parasponia andersonii]
MIIVIRLVSSRTDFRRPLWTESIRGETFDKPPFCQVGLSNARTLFKIALDVLSSSGKTRNRSGIFWRKTPEPPDL